MFCKLNLSYQGLGAAVLGLQVTSFVIIVLTSISTIYFICCNSSDDDDDDDETGCCTILGGCMVCLYPVAGGYISILKF